MNGRNDNLTFRLRPGNRSAPSMHGRMDVQRSSCGGPFPKIRNRAANGSHIGTFRAQSIASLRNVFPRYIGENCEDSTCQYLGRPGRVRPGWRGMARRSAMIGALTVAALLGRALPAEAFAPQQADCMPELVRLSAEWDAIGFGTPQKPSQQIVYGRFGLQSSGPEVIFLKASDPAGVLGLPARRCGDGPGAGRARGRTARRTLVTNIGGRLPAAAPARRRGTLFLQCAFIPSYS